MKKNETEVNTSPLVLCFNNNKKNRKYIFLHKKVKKLKLKIK